MSEYVSGLDATTADVPLNTRMLLEHAARSHHDQEVVAAMPDGRHVITYGDLYERAGKAAHVVDGLGVEPGDVVGMYGFSTPQYMELLYAISGIGATPFTMNLELPREHERFCLDHVTDHAPCDTIVVAPELVDDLDDLVADGDDFEYVVPREPVETDLAPVHSYPDLMDDAPAGYDWPEVDETTAAVLMFTSGTTGKPKAVAHAHRMIYLHCIGMVATKGVGPQDSHLMVPPMFHLGWLLWAVAPAAGSRLILPGPGYPDNLAELFLEEEVTFTAGVPTLFRRIVDIVEDRRADGEEIDLAGTEIVFGGQSPPTALLRDLEDLGATTSQVYGYTEVGPQFSFNVQSGLRDRERAMSEDELLDYKSRVAGYLVAGADAKVVDPAEGTELPWDGESEGEICFRAPWGTAGYWEMPEKTDEAMREDGYLAMGDLVRMDEHANIEVRDRIKDVIKSGGEWIPSTILEDLIADHPDVADGVVIAADHPEWMERPVAVVTLADDASGDAGIDLEAHLAPAVERGEIEKWWIPERTIVVEEIPKTSVGKHDKKTLRDEYGGVLVD